MLKETFKVPSEIPTIETHDKFPIETYIGGLEQLIASYNLNEKFKHPDEYLPMLPQPWTAVSTGGDMKLIATAEAIGISIKRYAKEMFAYVVWSAYQEIRALVLLNNFPLLLPVARYKDMLIFPYVMVDHSVESNREALDTLRSILAMTELQLPIKFAKRLGSLITSSGTVYYIDPFEDDAGTLSNFLD